MVRDVAQFMGDQQRWLPLDMNGRTLGASQGEVAVEALAWDGVRQVLYIGGHFNQVSTV